MKYYVKIGDKKKIIPKRILDKYKPYIYGKKEQLVQYWISDFNRDVSDHFNIPMSSLIIVK